MAKAISLALSWRQLVIVASAIAPLQVMLMNYNAAVVIALWKSFGIPEPYQEFEFVPGRKFRADFAWPAVRLVVECEGGVFSKGRHGRGAGIHGDMQRGNQGAKHGWRMLRYLPKELLQTATALEILQAVNCDNNERK